MERYYSHSLDIGSLRVLCKCPNLKKKKYMCEYKGNPHFLGSSYVKGAVAYCKEVAQVVSNEFVYDHDTYKLDNYC